MSYGPEFSRIVRAIKRGEVLSESATKGPPPLYEAHMTIDGYEYSVSLKPTKLGAVSSDLEE